MTWNDIVLTFWVCDQYPLMCPVKLIFLNFGFCWLFEERCLNYKKLKLDENYRLYYSKWPLFFITAFSYFSCHLNVWNTQKIGIGILNFRVKTECLCSVSPRMIRKQQCMRRFLNFVTNNKANLARSSPCENPISLIVLFSKKKNSDVTSSLLNARIRIWL